MAVSGDAAAPELGRRLVAWYRREQRDLPWRQVDDPYAILVAEIMLQQTQVSTVIPYWQAFLKRFPTFAHLAAASEDEVLRAWEGLGYYRRAKYLHRTAQLVTREYGGILPSDESELRRLPGIGPYTAAAVTSIAFNRPAVAMDGNAARVAARLFAVDRPIDEAAVRRALAARLKTAIPSGQAGDFTQALMELGSQVCRPRQPDCGSCPIRPSCTAFEAGRQHELPRTSSQPPVPTVERVAAVIPWDRGIIMYRRPEGLLGGLWALPDGERNPDEPSATAAGRILQEGFGVSATAGAPAASIQHRFTHRLWQVEAVPCRLGSTAAAGLPILSLDADPPANHLFRVPAHLLAELAVGGPDRKLLSALTAHIPCL